MMICLMILEVKMMSLMKRIFKHRMNKNCKIKKLMSIKIKKKLRMNKKISIIILKNLEIKS